MAALLCPTIIKHNPKKEQGQAVDALSAPEFLMLSDIMASLGGESEALVGVE